MKKLFLILCLLSHGLFGQVQRLAILPTLGSLKFGFGEAASLATICIDAGRAAPYNDAYKFFHAGQNIPIKVNGSNYPGGLKAAIEGPNPILKLSAYDEAEISLRINPTRKDIRSVEVGKVEKPAVVGTLKNDNQNIHTDIIDSAIPDLFKKQDVQAKYWKYDKIISAKMKSGKELIELKEDLKQFDKYSKILSNVSEDYATFSLFEDIDDYERIKLFQKASGITPSGKFDKKTTDALDSYSKFLEENFDNSSNYYYYPKGYVASLNAIYGNSKYLIKSDGKYSLLVKDGIWKRQTVTAQDIDDFERLSFQFLKDDIFLNNKDVRFLRIGSRNNQTQKAGLFTGNELQEINWTRSESFDEVLIALDKILKETPDDVPVVLSRDELQASLIGRSDEVGEKFIHESPVAEKSWINPVELMKELKNKYPNKRFYLSRGLSGISRLKNQPKIRGPKDVAAYIASKDEGISDQQLSRMKDVLREGGVTYHEVNEAFLTSSVEVQEANILLVSGHKNANFENYLKSLADNGKLEGKVLGIFSCFERGTTDLHAYLIKKGYANNVIFFPMRISQPATQALLREITALLPKVADINRDGILLDDCIQQAVINLMNNKDFSDLKPELEQLQLHLNQLSINLKNYTLYGKS